MPALNYSRTMLSNTSLHFSLAFKQPNLPPPNPKYCTEDTRKYYLDYCIPPKPKKGIRCKPPVGWMWCVHGCLCKCSDVDRDEKREEGLGEAEEKVKCTVSRDFCTERMKGLCKGWSFCADGEDRVE
jgi:hypothetical protein